MKKQRLVDKDYSRLLRSQEVGETEKSEKGSQSGQHPAKRMGQVTVMDQFSSMGRTDRERVLRRWSEKSIRTSRNGVHSIGWKRESVGRKTVNRGKIERDRGRTRTKGAGKSLDANKQVKTGMYTRIGMKVVKGNEIEALEGRLESIGSVKRRGIGRKDTKKPTKETQRIWFGDFESVKTEGMHMNEEGRYGVRGSMKAARNQQIKGETVVDQLKTYYSRSRRKRMRMQRRMRSRVRVSQEKARGTTKA